MNDLINNAKNIAKCPWSYASADITEVIEELIAIAMRINQTAEIGDAQSSFGDAQSSFGDAQSSFGDAQSSFGDAQSSFGDGLLCGGDGLLCGGEAQMVANPPNGPTGHGGHSNSMLTTQATEYGPARDDNVYHFTGGRIGPALKLTGEKGVLL